MSDGRGKPRSEFQNRSSNQPSAVQWAPWGSTTLGSRPGIQRGLPKLGRVPSRSLVALLEISSRRSEGIPAGLSYLLLHSGPSLRLSVCIGNARSNEHGRNLYLKVHPALQRVAIGGKFTRGVIELDPVSYIVSTAIRPHS